MNDRLKQRLQDDCTEILRIIVEKYDLLEYNGERVGLEKDLAYLVQKSEAIELANYKDDWGK